MNAPVPPPQEPAGPPLPFFPPQLPEDEAESVKLAAEQLADIRQAVIDEMNVAFGFWALPPRQRFAIYLANEPNVIQWIGAMEQFVPEEAGKMAQDYASLRKRYGA